MVIYVEKSILNPVFKKLFVKKIPNPPTFVRIFHAGAKKRYYIAKVLSFFVRPMVAPNLKNSLFNSIL